MYYSTPTIARQAAKQADLEEFGVIYHGEGRYSYEAWDGLHERLHEGEMVTLEEHRKKIGSLWIRV